MIYRKSNTETFNEFKQMIMPIKEIKDVYAEHRVDKIIFYISYDKGSRTDVIEKIVDIEIELRKIFNLKFDFYFFPSKEMPSLQSVEAIYSRRD